MDSNVPTSAGDISNKAVIFVAVFLFLQGIATLYSGHHIFLGMACIGLSFAVAVFKSLDSRQ